MTINDVTEIMSSGLYTIIITAAPVLLVSLVIGLVVSIFQTVTSIQEQTLTFVPKVIGIFVSLMILGHWMLNNMVEYMANLWADFTIYIK
ncbi:flagellar biosynthesis protein FliQ [Lacrimispora saccharolytica]|uniref:flagellar biosynthesis protein FliQ n=1 Tax=Lacrimispora saccharolytica TaxID=84030 RepID=UPI001B4C5EC5|nr:flagellar biosynthesis protein FliQ [Lacrimispora saccharolytica]MBP9000598.1 flagellar biosynthesis protein FliQ [Lachnospiraceae bacterium]MBS7330103.1 flagellar biosynthesis protein FliQ [Lachnospiraceae bacterium]MCF2655814.1 flagellar biosynthesis protein FliQ [Lacrimispora saccharolytica]MCI7558417.1 flagellar biosynthesis protein FliQ [Lachnospiraceae bacterium]MDD7548716.1 flagellar biosynthesis protein FliQ [Lachnospiraceae bacterium]